MGSLYTVGVNIKINYNPEDAKKVIDRLKNYINSNPVEINKLKLSNEAISSVKTKLDKLQITLENVSLNTIKLTPNVKGQIKNTIEGLSFKLGNLKLDTSKIKDTKLNLQLYIPPAQIQTIKQQIEGLKPVIKVTLQAQNQVTNPASGSMGQAREFANAITTSEKYAGSTLIDYEYSETGKLIAVLKTAQNETVKLTYQFNQAKNTFEQIGSRTKVPDLLNRSTESAQRTFEDIRKITEQFKLLQQQASGNPIDFKTQKLIPDLELLNSKIRTLSNGMQQVTQTYKLNESQTMSVSGNYNALAGQMDSLSTSTGNLANRQIGLSEAFRVAISRFPVWIAASTLIMGSLHKLSEAFDFMLEESRMFTNLQLEMTNTSLVFSEITNTANQFADAMGSTTEKVMKAISVFGTYTSTIDEVLTKSKSAVTLANITGEGVEQTSDELMGILSQFKLGAGDITNITDSLLGSARNLQMDFPKAVAEVSSGLRTVGSVAKEAGLSVQETTGILSTMVEVTRRSGSENANALRTIMSRISNVGEESNPEEFKGIEKKFYNIGIAIKSSATEIRPLGDILAELGEKWKTLDDIERQSIATASAGMYRRNAFMSLMDNYDKVLDNVNSAENSEGVTMQKQEIYSNSLQASIERLTNAWQGLYLSAINNDTWKTLIKGLTGAINGFTKFADVVGGIPAILTSVVLAGALFSNKFRGFINRSFYFAPIVNFRNSIYETIAVMKQFSGYANTWRTNPFVVGFQMAKTSIATARTSITQYITSLRLAYAQQLQMGRSAWLSSLSIGFKGVTDAVKAFTASTIASRIALSALQAVATLGISVVFSLIIGKVISFADNMINAKEKAKEAIETLSKSVQSLKGELSEIPSLISSYEELFGKIGKTTEEKEELASTTEKLASLFGDAVVGLDAEGKATQIDIEYVKQLTQAKKDLLKAQEEELASKFNTTGKDQYDDILNKQQRINEINKEIEKKNKALNNAQNYSKEDHNSVSQFLNNEDIERYQESIAELSAERAKLTSDSNEIQQTLAKEAYAFDQSNDSVNNLSQSLINNLAKATVDSGKGFEDLKNTMKVFNNSEVSQAFSKISEDMTKGVSFDKAKQDIEEFSSALLKNNVDTDIATNLINIFNNALKIDNASKAEEKLLDVDKAIEEITSSTDEYLKNAEDLASTVAKLNDGHKLTVKELYELIKAHPELASALIKENNLLTLNKESIEKVMEANDKAFKEKLDQNKKILEDEEKLLKKKLFFYGQEVGAIKDLVLARQKEQDLFEGSSGDAGISSAMHSQNQKIFDDLQNIENELKGIEVTRQISPKDLVASSDPDLNKSSKEKEEPVTGPYADLIRESAKQNQLSATLVDAVVKQESGFRANVTSSAGAMGLMQLMPSTAQGLGVTNAYDPAQSLAGGTKYLRQLMDMFGNDIELALAGYNAGQGTVLNALRKTGGKSFSDIKGLLPNETQNYVTSIMGDYNSRKLSSATIDDIVNRKDIQDTLPFTSPVDAIIAETKSQAQLTEEKNKDIQASIDQASSAKDYVKQLEETNNLLTSQQEELTQLNTARGKINYYKDDQLKGSKFGDISRWFTDQNEASTAYIYEKNQATAEVQKQMEAEFDIMQKLRNAWLDNRNAVEELNKSVQNTITSIKQIQDAIDELNFNNITDAYNKEINSFKNKLDQYDLIGSFIDEKDFSAKKKLVDSKLKTTLSEIKAIEKQIKSIDSMDISKKQKEDLFKQWSEDLKSALSSYVSLENEVANNAQQKLDIIKDIEQEIMDMIKQGYQDEMDAEEKLHNQKIKDLQDEKDAYDEIIQAKIDSIDAEKSEDDYNDTLNELQKERNDLQKQYDATLLDTSDSAEVQRDELNKAIVDKDKEIQKAIYEHGVEYRKKGLEDQQKAFDDAKDDEMDAEEKAYEEYKEIMEQKMSDENLYYEARRKLSKETTNSLIQDLTTYTNKFGEGMSLLGDSIKDNLIENLKIAKKELSNIPDLIDEVNNSSSGKGNSTTDDAVDTINNPPKYSDNKRDVYGSSTDIASAEQILGTKDFRYYVTTKPNPNDVSSDDIVVGGSGIISNFKDLQKTGATFLYGFDAQGTKNEIQKWANTHGYSEGGVNTTTGFAMLHGTSNKPEMITNYDQTTRLFNFIKNLPTNPSEYAPKVAPLSVSPPSSSGVKEVNINLTVEGNLDKTVLPDVKNTLASTAQNLKKELNKMGIYKG